MSIVYPFIYWLIDWFFELHSKSVNRSVSLSIVIETNSKWLNDWMIEWLNDWSSCIRFVAHRLWEMLRKENHWTDLESFIQSQKYPIAIHNIGPLYQLLCFVSINDPFYVQHVPYHSHTHFKTIFAGLLVHFQLWMTEIESDLDITTNHIPIHSHSLSYYYLYHNQI